MIFSVSNYLPEKTVTTTAKTINEGIPHQPNSNMNIIKSNISDITQLYALSTNSQ